MRPADSANALASRRRTLLLRRPARRRRPHAWVSVVLVAVGALTALLGTRDLSHAGPVRRDEPTAPLRELVRGITILREPRVAAGAFVHLVNTGPNFALFVVAPLHITRTIGFSQSTYLLLVICVFTANIFANLLFGIVGDWLGWRRTVT